MALKNDAQGGVRINKYLADCGLASRRGADELIAKGLIRVDGRVAGPGDRVFPGMSVSVNGKEVKGREDKVYLAYYKPVGVTCTEKDSHAKTTVIENLGVKVRVTYAGRLDKDSEGLLIMTNDGDLIHAMMQGSAGHEKEYLVKVDKELSEEDLSSMEKGVYLRELNQTTRPCVIHKEGKFTFRIILTQGLNRQIRRMCHQYGYEVKALKRVRVVNILLGNLKPGMHRALTTEELKELKEWTRKKDILS